MTADKTILEHKKHLCSIICRNIEDFISKLQIMEHP